MAVKTIKATSRASVKIRDSFYTFEYSEEHTLDGISGQDYADYKKKLWDTVNTEVDNQIIETVEMLKGK